MQQAVSEPLRVAWRVSSVLRTWKTHHRGAKPVVRSLVLRLKRCVDHDGGACELSPMLTWQATAVKAQRRVLGRDAAVATDRLTFCNHHERQKRDAATVNHWVRLATLASMKRG